MSQSQLPAQMAGLYQQRVKQTGVDSVLQAIRKHLGMDVAFISRFRGKEKVFQYIDASGALPFPVGLVVPLEQGYCFRIAKGDLPELIPDTAEAPVCDTLPETKAFGIAAHLGVPIQLGNGEIYGTLCCFSRTPDPTLNQRDLSTMRAFAEVLAAQIDDDVQHASIAAAKVQKLRHGMGGASMHLAYQPIYSLRSGCLTGVECLSRFRADAALSPIQWFQLADEVDLRQDLEITAMRLALSTMAQFPEWIYFGMNSSPQSILSGALEETLEGCDLSRVVVEITEHSVIEDYPRLSATLRPLRQQGLRLAIDDAGAGYASMRHIVDLLPDIIKLDISLVRNIDQDPVRRALAKALIAFSAEIGSCITAEGIETHPELDILRHLGADFGQGYLFARPMPLDDAFQADGTHKLLREKISLTRFE